MWRMYSTDNLLFILHRITGVGLLAYLLIHIWMVSTAMLGGPEMFDRVMGVLAAPEFLIADIVLLGSITFHMINGLRLMAHERGWWLENSDALARLTVAVWLGLWVTAGTIAVAA